MWWRETTGVAVRNGGSRPAKRTKARTALEGFVQSARIRPGDPRSRT